MVTALHKIFNLYPGEKKKALLLSLLGFIWSLGASCGHMLSDALFIAHVGTKHFPHAFIITATIMFVTTIFFLKALNRYSPAAIFKCVLIIGASFYFLSYYSLIRGLPPNSPAFWFITKIYSYALFISLMTCYWTYVDQYYTFYEAKRLFALFNSAIFGGVAIGGGWILSIQSFEMHYRFLFIFCCLALSFIIITILTPHLTPLSHITSETAPTPHSKPTPSLKQILISIITSKFTILLLSANILIQLLELFTEYEYMTIFENHFSALYGTGNIEVPMTLFIGNLTVWVSIGNIVLSVFFYSRLVKKFDINNIALVIPFLFFLLFSLRIFGNASLYVPIFGFSISEGLLYTVNDNNFTLLLNGVPMNVKRHVRVLSESFFEPLGMMISSLTLLFFSNMSALIGFSLSLLTLAIAITLRAYYHRALAANNIYSNEKSGLIARPVMEQDSSTPALEKAS